MWPESRIPLAVMMASFDPGGPEHQMIELIRRLDRRRWEVHVACLRKEGAWLQRAVDTAEADVFVLPSLSEALPTRCSKQ